MEARFCGDGTGPSVITRTALVENWLPGAGHQAIRFPGNDQATLHVQSDEQHTITIRAGPIRAS